MNTILKFSVCQESSCPRFQLFTNHDQYPVMGWSLRMLAAGLHSPRAWKNSLDLIISVKVSHSVTVSVYSLLTQYYCNFIPSWKETFENNLPYCGLSKETTSFEIFVGHIWPHRLICSYCASFSLELKFLRKIRIRVKNISHATTGAISLSSWHCLPRIYVSMKG